MENSLQSRQVPLESDQTASKSWLIFGQAEADLEHWNEAPNVVVAILTRNLLYVFFIPFIFAMECKAYWHHHRGDLLPHWKTDQSSKMKQTCKPDQILGQATVTN